jgi:hypothetical protein
VHRWSYLWQMPAEELLAITPVTPLVLVGQTQIARPEVILPTVVTRLRHVTDFELRSRLFTTLLALLPAEEGRCAPSADAVAEKR